ncbi:MAG TPA: hypothetical protein VGO87_03505 [Acidimicrobiia bacterium]
MTTTTSRPQPELLELVTVAEFLIRNGHQGAASVATERLADGLLAFYQTLPASASPEEDGLRREALRLWSEVRLIGDRLRIGPLRRGVPPLRRKVEALLMLEGMIGTQRSEAFGP